MQQVRGSGAAQRVGGGQHWLWNVRSENITHQMIFMGGSGGLPPGKIPHVRSSESVFLDTFTMLLK